MIRRPPRSTPLYSSAASDVYKRQLRNLSISKPNQVWAVDITYIKMGRSHMYMTAVIDWYSRYIVGWALSDTLDTAPVLEAVCTAIQKYGNPLIINSDYAEENTMPKILRNHCKSCF